MKTSFKGMSAVGMFALILSACNNSDTVAPLNVPPGPLLSGAVFTGNDNPVADAKVRVFPADYLPQPEDALGKRSAVASTPVLTHTNGKGEYVITGLSPGLYNILIESSGLASWRDSVSVAVDSTVVPADTLRPVGAFTGKLAIQPFDDPRNFQLQIQGSPFIALPDPKAGFVFAGMPQGRYRVRVSATGSGYRTAVFSAQVSAGGKDSAAQAWEPPYTGIPTVKGLTVTLDTLHGLARISWRAANFPRLANYVLERTPYFVSSLQVPPYYGSQYSLPSIRLGAVDTVWIDTIYPQHHTVTVYSPTTGTYTYDTTGLVDTTSYPLTYRIAIQDLSDNQGAFFDKVSVVAVSPSRVTTAINFGADSTSILYTQVGERGVVKVRFANPTRKVVQLAWEDKKGQVLRKQAYHDSAGLDSLSFTAPDTVGNKFFRVLITDDAGTVWKDSLSLPVVAWKRLADRPIAAYNHAGSFPVEMPVAALNDKLYTFGGSGADPHGASAAFDPATGKWTSIAEAPILGDPILAAGQIFMTSEEKLTAYDPVQDKWVEKPSWPFSRSIYHPGPNVVFQNKIVAFAISSYSGYYYYSNGSSAYYDIDANQSVNRGYINYMFDGSVIFPGRSKIYWSDNSFRLQDYDPETNATSSVGSMPNTYSPYQFLGEMNGFNYFLAGNAIMEIFDMDRETWTSAPAPQISGAFTSPYVTVTTPQSTYQFLNGKLYALWESAPNRINVEVYDPGVRTWSHASAIYSQGDRFVSTVVSGKLYVLSYYDKSSPQADSLPALYEYPPLP